MKKTSVVILNWNGLELLKKFLPTASLYTIDDDTQLVVADNGSTDGSVEWVRENHPEVEVMPFSENYGFAAGYNKVAELIDTPYFLLLNSDVEVTPGWVKPLVEFLDANPDFGAVQPKILSFRQKNKFEYAGAAGGYLDCNGYPYCRGRLFDSIEEDNGQYDNAEPEICWASGAAILTRTKLYRETGGLDARFFAHMEEIDYCCRLWGSGYKVGFCPRSSVYHVGGASLNQGNPKKTYLNFRNNLLLLHKNLPLKKGKKFLFYRRLLDTLAFGMFILKGDFPNAKAILKAHSDFRKMKRDYTSHPENDFLSTLPGSRRNILIDYYIRKQKK